MLRLIEAFTSDLLLPREDSSPRTEYPSDVRQGDIVQADLAIRVSRIGSTSNPAFVAGHVFQIETAECFLLVPDCTPKTTQIVAPRFRVWNGEPDIEQAVAVDKEELLRLLMEVVDQEEVAS